MKKIVVWMLALGLMVALVVGCGDDDTPTEPNDLETGSLDDAEFVLAEEAFYGAEDFSDEMFFWMELFIDSIFWEASQQGGSSAYVDKPLADSIFATYHGSSQYWYLYFRAVDTTWGAGDVVEEIVTVILRDSMQFLHGTDPVQWPDTMLLTSVINGAGLSVSTMTGLGNAMATQNVTVVGAAGEIANHGDVTLDGTRTFTLVLVGEGGQCSVELDASATATEVAMNVAEMEEGGCPASGNLVHVATITIECTGDTTFTFSDTWTFDQTFFGDTIQVVVENSTTRWTFTDTCEVSGVTRPYAELFARIRQ